MAIKTIDLVINTSRGEQNVKKLHQLAKQVEKTFGNLNKLKINIKTDTAQKKLSALEKEINKGNRKIDAFLKTANPGMRFFGNSIGKARDNLAAVRKAFDDATNATARQNGATTLLAGNFRKLRMEAVAFAQASGADPSKTIGNVSARIKEIQGFPRTIMAGNEAMTLLKRMQDMTIAGSKEFLQVSRAIGEQLKVNATIQMAASRGANPMKGNQVFATPEQIKALKGNKLISPSMRLPQAGESGGKFVELKSKPIEKAVKNIQKSSNKTANILTQQSAFGLLPPAGGTTSPINARFSRANLGFGKNANPQGLFAMPGGATGRLKGAAGSAMIGGGFPALFGAGGISSLMGGIAGGIGGALAPGGGFALSIAATAIAAQIEKAIQFRKAVKKLNEEVAAMGIGSEFSRKNIKKLAKDFDVTNDEAVKLASTVKTFGEKQGLAILKTFGSREIFDALAGLRDTSSVLGKINQLQEEISESKRQELLQSLATEGPLKTQLKLEQAILEKKRKLFIEDKKREELIKKLDEKYGGGSYLGAMPDKNQESPEQQLKRLNELFDKTNEKQIKFLQNQIKINEQTQFLTEFNAPTDQLREMLNPMRRILDLSVAIKDGFENSFKGIIKGTMSVQDAFRSMLNKIADHFLDAAARMAATQLQKGFLGLFSNMFNFTKPSSPTNLVELSGLPSSPSNMVPSLSNTSPSDLMIPSFNPYAEKRANGGPVKGGGRYLVGERGPELFSPGVSGMITPNEMLSGSTNIVVNVDASGTSVEGNQTNGEELGRLIGAVVQSELIKEKRPGGLLA